MSLDDNMCWTDWAKRARMASISFICVELFSNVSNVTKLIYIFLMTEMAQNFDLMKRILCNLENGQDFK